MKKLSHRLARRILLAPRNLFPTAPALLPANSDFIQTSNFIQTRNPCSQAPWSCKHFTTSVWRSSLTGMRTLEPPPLSPWSCKHFTTSVWRSSLTGMPTLEPPPLSPAPATPTAHHTPVNRHRSLSPPATALSSPSHELMQARNNQCVKKLSHRLARRILLAPGNLFPTAPALLPANSEILFKQANLAVRLRDHASILRPVCEEAHSPQCRLSNRHRSLLRLQLPPLTIHQWTATALSCACNCHRSPHTSEPPPHSPAPATATAHHTPVNRHRSRTAPATALSSPSHELSLEYWHRPHQAGWLSSPSSRSHPPHSPIAPHTGTPTSTLTLTTLILAPEVAAHQTPRTGTQKNSGTQKNWERDQSGA